MAFKMVSVILVFGLLTAQAAAHTADQLGSAQGRQQSLERVWSHELSASWTAVSPIKRVVNLLMKMKAELEKEASNESAMYDKMVCWCETNEKEKTKAVADAEAKDKDLMAEIEQRSASVGELVATIQMLKKQIAEDTASLKKAAAIREKTAAEFLETETDLVQTMTNLRNAVGVLAKQQGGGFLQMTGPLISGMRVWLRSAAMKYEVLHGEIGVGPQAFQTVLLSLQSETKRFTTSAEQALLSALDVHGESMSDSLPLKFAELLVAKSAAGARSQTGSFLQAGTHQPKSSGSYNAASGGIYGIMTQMLEDFEAQLSTAEKDEKKAAEDFAGLKEAKSEQIAVAKEKLDDIESGSSENLKALSDAKEDLAMTRKQRTMDIKFLRNLQDTCNDLDKQWERRSATRAAEIEAVSETIAILTEDDARELMAKSVSLLQQRIGTVATLAAARRYRTATFLRRAAQVPDFEADDLLSAWHGRHAVTTLPRAQLSTLAMSVQLDSFAKVKAMMDKMVAELKNQQQEEAEFKAYCTKEFDKTEKAVYEKKEEKTDLEAKIEKLDILKAKLAKEIQKAKKQISESSDEIKKASKSREEGNAEFQTVVADQSATQVILKKALTRLENFYKKGKGNKLVLAEQEPPVKFNKYKKNAGASPVMGLIEQIIEDSEKLVAEATESEYKAQGEYEKFVTNSNAIIKQLSEDVEAKTKATATAKGESAEAKGDLENAVGELESLAQYDADLHGECDFVLKNFDIRQKARLQEMEAIQAAKGILSGAK